MVHPWIVDGGDSHQMSLVPVNLLNKRPETD